MAYTSIDTSYWPILLRQCGTLLVGPTFREPCKGYTFIERRLTMNNFFRPIFSHIFHVLLRLQFGARIPKWIFFRSKSFHVLRGLLCDNDCPGQECPDH